MIAHGHWLANQTTARLRHVLRGLDDQAQTTPQYARLIEDERIEILTELARRERIGRTKTEPIIPPESRTRPTLAAIEVIHHRTRRAWWQFWRPRTRRIVIVDRKCLSVNRDLKAMGY